MIAFLLLARGTLERSAWLPPDPLALPVPRCKQDDSRGSGDWTATQVIQRARASGSMRRAKNASARDEFKHHSVTVKRMLARLDLTRLESAYAKVRDRLGPERSECFEAALVVEQLRSMWRPDRVRIVLLAESHVWTSRDEAASQVHHPDRVVTGFARFIYCLGGDEPTLVTPAVFPNYGATQYWKLLHDTVRGPHQSHAGLMKGGETNAAKRIENKLELLKNVRQAGIWLVDASLPAEKSLKKPLAYRPARSRRMVNVSLRAGLLHPAVAASGREVQRPEVKREAAQNFFDIGSYACSNSG